MLCIHVKLHKCNLKNTVERNGMEKKWQLVWAIPPLGTLRSDTILKLLTTLSMNEKKSHNFFIDMHVCVDKYVILVIHFVQLSDLFQRNIEKWTVTDVT